MSHAASDTADLHSLYAPSLRLRRRAWSCYGVGHTARRHPGDMRGTVVGKKGRFKIPFSRKEAMLITQR